MLSKEKLILFWLNTVGDLTFGLSERKKKETHSFIQTACPLGSVFLSIFSFSPLFLGKIFVSQVNELNDWVSLIFLLFTGNQTGKF